MTKDGMDHAVDTSDLRVFRFRSRNVYTVKQPIAILHTFQEKLLANL